MRSRFLKSGPMFVSTLLFLAFELAAMFALLFLAASLCFA